MLERIADDYRQRGFDVLVQPRGSALPEFLGHDTPDLIARRPGEVLVVEVKNSARAVDPVRIAAITQRLSAHPGWRFVLLAPAPDEHANSDSEPTTLDEHAIHKLLEEARALSNQGHAEAGLLLTWAATEAALRLIAARYGVESPRLNPAALLRALASEGAIAADDLHELNRILATRSAVAHGLRPAHLDAEGLGKETFRLAEVAIRLLAQRSA